MIILLLVSYFYGSSEMVSLPVLGLVLATIGLFWYWKKIQREKKLNGLKEIPGPWGLPLIGNVLQLGKIPHLQYSKWSEKYGDIYKVQLGKQQLVVISDPKLTKEIFSNDPAFTGKPHIPGFEIYEGQPGLGLFGSEGELWETHRRFFLRNMRDFGFGKSAMETLIMDELQEVLGRFKQHEGKPVSNIRETLRLAVFNSIWTILTSQRFQQDDPKLTTMTRNTTECIVELFEKGSLVLFIPWLRHVIPEWSGYNSIRRVFEETKFLFEETIRKHKAVLQEDNLRDFLDVYLAEVKKTTDPKSYFHESMAEKNLVASLFDLFVAGNDTTAVSFTWTVVYLCKCPEIQERLQKEIEDVTGDSRSVSLADRSDMPYTLALIDEVLRHSSVTPDGVQHRAMADRGFNGFFIPKDAWIQPNLYFIHHNPKIWGDPENFRPERFLSEDGTKYQKNENLQAFQPGKRQCIGEGFARDSMFLYVTNFFQKYSMKFDPNSPEPSFASLPGFVRSPQPYSIIMTDRQTK